MSFDPSNCNLVVTPFPSDHLLTDASVPDALTKINDCSVFDIPVLFPEGPCPTIISTESVVHFNRIGGYNLDERISVQQATEECLFHAQFDLNPPCLFVEASGQFNYVPFSAGVDARLTHKTVKNDDDSATIHDNCYLGLFLDIDIPSQSCPTIVSGTNDITVLPPGEAASLVVTVTQTDDSEDTSCAFRVDLDLQVPCTGVEISGSDVNFDSGGGAPPHGSIRVVTLSAIPCQFDFQVLLDLSSVVFDPLTAPAITDFCVNSSGQVQSAEVTYYTWPGGTIAYQVWRSQFGYCDENGCYSEPLDFGLYNTGCDGANHAMSDTCQDDTHWKCDGVAAKSMAFAAYPAVWLRPGRRSRWIAKTCSGIEDSGVTQTFSTTFTIPGTISAADFALEGILDADNWVTEIRVNGVAVPIHRLTDVFPGTNDYELRGPMYRFLLKSNFVIGANTVEFDVNSTDFIGPDLPSWLGFRVEWTGVGACNSMHTTTTTTSTTPAPTTTAGPTSSTSTTSTTPRVDDCPCHFQQGDIVQVTVVLQGLWRSSNPPYPDCHLISVTKTVTLPDPSPLGGDLWHSDFECLTMHITDLYPDCDGCVYIGFYRFPHPYPGGPMMYGHYVGYSIYGPSNPPYWIAQFPQFIYNCLVSCSPKKYRVDFDPPQYPEVVYQSGVVCYQYGTTTFYSLLPPDQQARLVSFEVVKIGP